LNYKLQLTQVLASGRAAELFTYCHGVTKYSRQIYCHSMTRISIYN